VRTHQRAEMAVEAVRRHVHLIDVAMAAIG
jgi:hypothetical protein